MILIVALLACLLLPSPAAAQDEAPWGCLGYYLGEPVSEVELSDFFLDEYFKPDLYYSQELERQFEFGSEIYRLSLGVKNDQINQILYEYITFWEGEDGETQYRENIDEIADTVFTEVSEQCADWESEYWHFSLMGDVDPPPPEYECYVFDFYNDQYCLSYRYSVLGVTVVYEYVEDRQMPGTAGRQLSSEDESDAEAGSEAESSDSL